MKICVTGGRDYSNKEFVEKVFNLLGNRIEHVGVGCATGLDALVRDYTISNNLSREVFNADWTGLGRSAGPIRNEKMLRDTKPDYLFVFPGGRGTQDCKSKAIFLGIKIIDLSEENLDKLNFTEEVKIEIKEVLTSAKEKVIKSVDDPKEYVNLHLHSEYSSLDGFSRFEDMVDESILNEDGSYKVIVEGITSKLVSLGHKKCAVTDHGSLSAILPAYESFKKKGIDLIPGCEFYIVDDMKNMKAYQNHLVVLAKNEKGWKNILKMNYIGFEQGSREIWGRQVPRIDLKTLAKYSSDLVVSSACLAGLTSHYLVTDQQQEAEDHIKLMKQLFGDSYFLEVQVVDYYSMLDSGSKTLLIDKEWIENQAETQKKANDRIIDIGDKLKVKIVATTDAHYVNKVDRDTHLLMLAIQSKTSIDSAALGNKERGGRLAFEATPMLSANELINVFTETNSSYNGYPKYMIEEWLANTHVAANMCSPAKYLDFTGYKIPLFPVEDSSDYSSFLRWKDSLDKEQIEKILDKNEDFLKSRLVVDK